MINYKLESYSLAGLSILVAGILRLQIYYKGFNVSILPFIELDDVAKLLLDNLLYFFFFTLLNFFVLAFFYKKDLSYKDISRTSFIERVKYKGFLKIDKIIVILIFALGLFVIQSFKDRIYFYEYGLWLILLMIEIYLIPLLIFELKIFLFKNNIDMNRLSILFLITSINLFAFSSLSGYNELYKVKCKNYYLYSELEIDNENVFISSKEKYYIGKTNKYVFLYNSSTEETEVLPISRIEKIKFKR